MASLDVRTRAGASAGTVEVDERVFCIQPNVPVMHQVVTAQLAAARSGTHSVLRRSEVRGGGAKPWRQKGTGRARQGSIRATQWRGGGVPMGPKPRDYSQRTPKKMVRLALYSALSDRFADGKVAVVEAWDFDGPKTRDARASLSALGLDGKVLLVVSRDDEVAYKSFRNLPEVQVMLAGELNAYDILANDWVVFTRETLPVAREVSHGRTGAAAAAPTQTSAPVAPAETTTAATEPGTTPPEAEGGE